MGSESKFIGDRIQVTVADLEKPTQFIWKKQTYTIVKIAASSRRLDLQSTWYRRRHRDYFIVEVATGQRFEIYRHRLPGKPYWVLTRELPPEP